MKRLYWRPAGPSTTVLVALGVFAASLLAVVEHFPSRSLDAAHAEKLAAARLAERAIAEIRAERPRRGLPAFEPTDRARTGLIGPATSEITTSTGSLPSKRTAANPNFAAVVVDYLHRLELEKGDVVAVGYSGSFPGLNVAVLAAVETLGLVPIVIASAASSDFGAASPNFGWLDMEKLLRARGVFHHTSFAASVGGIEDQGIGLSKAGHDLLLGAIARSGAALIEPYDFQDSLAHRMQLYDQAARGRPIRAYVNVGGGTVSVGRSRGKTTYKPGINRPGTKAPVDSIIGRFLDRGVPVLHLTKAEELARQFRLPVDPSERQIPGNGYVFGHSEPNRLLALAALAVLGVALVVVGRRARARAHLVAKPDGVEAPPAAIEARSREKAPG